MSLSTHTMAMITDPGTIALGDAAKVAQGKSKVENGGNGKGKDKADGGVSCEGEESSEEETDSSDGTQSDDWHEDDTKARYCAKCRNVKPPLAHHCSICKRCVRRMDHHWRSPSPG